MKRQFFFIFWEFKFESVSSVFPDFDIIILNFFSLILRFLLSVILLVNKKFFFTLSVKKLYIAFERQGKILPYQ